MSDGIDIDGALGALTAELPDEVEGIGLDVVEESDISSEDNQSEAESFTGFDPTVLPEDMQKVYKSMQADYTRKTQEISDLRRQYESFSEAGVDADSALQAVGFLEKLNNDSQFALEVAENIRQSLGTPDVSQPVVAETPETSNESYDGLPPQLAKELEEMRAFRDEMLATQAQQETMAEIEAMENTIRTANPDYTDDDLEAVYSLAYAHNGDLLAAQQSYHQIQQRLLGSYLQAKTVPHGATPAPSSPSSVPGRAFGNLDDAHKAAMEAVRNIS
jgi:hypothetical protein